jgi:hypothetical protein
VRGGRWELPELYFDVRTDMLCRWRLACDCRFSARNRSAADRRSRFYLEAGQRLKQLQLQYQAMYTNMYLYEVM